MQNHKISLITVAFNADKTIDRCINSVLGQNFNSIQYIIIDGGSGDNTVNIINKYKDKIDLFVSEPDQGIYDAMNKGIAMATGDIVGTLNADDYFSSVDILSQVAASFANLNFAVLYGDLDYVDQNERIIRKWRSGAYKKRNVQLGLDAPASYLLL